MGLFSSLQEASPTAELHDRDDERDGGGDHDPDGAFGKVQQLDDPNGDAAGHDDGTGDHQSRLRASPPHLMSPAPVRHRSRRPSRALASAVTVSTSSGKSLPIETTSVRVSRAHGRHAQLGPANSTSAGAPTAAARWLTPESLPIQSAT